MRKLISTRDLAERTGIPEATWRFWRHSGKGPGSAKLGGRVVYDQAEVDAWIDRQFEANRTARGPAAAPKSA